MSNHKIKIIEAAEEISWSTTYQGTWEVNGKEVVFRFHESNKACDFYVFSEDRGWIDMYDMDPGSPEDIVFNMCLEYSPTEWGEDGEEVEWEPED